MNAAGAAAAIVGVELTRPKEPLQRFPLKSAAGSRPVLLCVMFAAGKAETSREIPCGRWEGSWSREEDADFGVVYQDGRLTLPMMPPAPLPFRMVDEGRGRFRATLGAVDL